MGFAAFTFLVIFLLIASGGLLIFYREAMLQRISAVITPAKQAALRHSIQRRVSVAGIVQRFERVLAQEPGRGLCRAAAPHPCRLSQRLRGKCLLWREGAGSPGLVAVDLAERTGQLQPVLHLRHGLGPGLSAARFLAGEKDRQAAGAIRRGLPDVLDLLVICMEAGQSLDQATARTAKN